MPGRCHLDVTLGQRAVLTAGEVRLESRSWILGIRGRRFALAATYVTPSSVTDPVTGTSRRIVDVVMLVRALCFAAIAIAGAVNMTQRLDLWRNR